MPTYVSPCPYDLAFYCNQGCLNLEDKPNWCTHRGDLYQKALELDKLRKEQEETRQHPWHHRYLEDEF